MNIKINDFDGPLDLLWHLIKAHKMDIYDINIEKITKEYLSFINLVTGMPFSVIAENS